MLETKFRSAPGKSDWYNLVAVPEVPTRVKPSMSTIMAVPSMQLLIQIIKEEEMMMKNITNNNNNKI